MVVVEEVDVAPRDARDEGGRKALPPTAVVITGAGLDVANGLYQSTGKMWHEAPVFENDQKCLLSREPHKNQKTGQMTFGWIIGQDRKALYAVQAEGLTPPSSGWRKFNGTAPPPQLQALSSAEEAAGVAGQAWKELGNQLFGARRYEEAADKWTRALGFVCNSADATLKAALYSNRAEARLRQQQWDAALGDAQAALQLKPAHEKALLRAAVAARELRRLDLAQDFVARCLADKPDHPEASQLLADIGVLVEEEASKDLAGRAKTARAKLQESIQREAEEGDIAKIPKAFAAKDRNSKKGFKAFEGYSEKRAKPSERPPLTQLPYHHMGLPQDQVETMDSFFQEMREKRDEKQRMDKEAEDAYESLKKEYRDRAQQDVAEGKAEPLEEILPSEKAKRQLQEKPKRLPEEQPRQEVQAGAGWARSLQSQRKQVDRAGIAQEDANAIDSLFRGMDEGVAPAAARPMLAPVASDRRQRLEKAKELVASGGKDAGGVDRRTARERQLDEEEAEERRQRDLRILYELRLAQATRRGEPTRFEQAGTEIYCWWKLPAEISGKEIKVKISQAGSFLTVSVRDVVLFDRRLFDTVRADDLVWSIDGGELHLTLTKGESNKLWEQLAEVGEVEKDESGQVKPETLPDPLPASERLEKFNQMITGDDGVEFNYEDLDAQGRSLVDAMRKYKHARATGDQKELAEAEMELEEFGQLVI